MICEIIVHWLVIVQKNRVRVFQNRVMRKIFWPKKEEVTGKS